jgi:hypothetical protein
MLKSELNEAFDLVNKVPGKIQNATVYNPCRVAASPVRSLQSSRACAASTNWLFAASEFFSATAKETKDYV